MVFYGFEKERGALKYRCPAAAYGMECCERAQCSPTGYGRVVRVPMEMDRRRFVPVPRDSYKWKRLYRGRTAVERVNSRLDVSFGFERHFIRGMQKMSRGHREQASGADALFGVECQGKEDSVAPAGRGRRPKR